MNRALIIGNSGGIGAALETALIQRDFDVTGLSRSGDGLDVTDEASVRKAMTALEGPFDRVIVATGALVINGAEPEKTVKTLAATAMADQFALNAIGPALVLKHTLPLIPRNKKAVFAVLSARVGSIGDNRLGGWYSYRAAKAALNQIIHSAAVELARTHRNLACVCLHPGTVATDFTRKYQAAHPTISPTVAAQNLADVMDSLNPQDTGRFFDYARREIPW